MKDWKDNIYFVLVEPVESGNIGAAARAMKNMGFRHLVLVNPPEPLGDEAWWFAHSAEDVLKKAKKYPTLKEALAPMHLVVGTTRRKGKRRAALKSLHAGLDLLAQEAASKKVAILFGREQKGLFTEETEECTYLYYIPTGGDQPSLNLAQAVMVMAYELARTGQLDGTKPRKPPPANEVLDILFERLWGIIKLLDFPARGNRDPEKGTHRQLKQLLRRAQITQNELDMLHSVCTQIELKLSPEEVRRSRRVAKSRKAG
jgi:TrmH family RNA methyltransferase